MSETMSRPRLQPREKAVVRNDEPASGTDTVTIGCKWPNGIVMRLYDILEEEINIQGRMVKENHAVLNPDYPEYVLNGFSIDLEKMAGGIPPEHQIVGGYGLTHGIPRDFAEKWFEQNRQSSMVKNKLVFMASSEQNARSQARDQASLKSGIEPIDPSNPAQRAGLRKGAIEKENSGAN